jgi:hypothetical protein
MGGRLMKVSESTVTKMLISGMDGLDSISAYFEDFGPAQGKFVNATWLYTILRQSRCLLNAENVLQRAAIRVQLLRMAVGV